jgi:hypothetical protein
VDKPLGVWYSVNTMTINITIQKLESMARDVKGENYGTLQECIASADCRDFDTMQSRLAELLAIQPELVAHLL